MQVFVALKRFLCIFVNFLTLVLLHSLPSPDCRNHVCPSENHYKDIYVNLIKIVSATIVLNEKKTVVQIFKYNLHEHFYISIT